MITTRQRVAALVLAGMMAVTGAFLASATFAASDAHALSTFSTSVVTYNTLFVSRGRGCYKPRPSLLSLSFRE